MIKLISDIDEVGEEDVIAQEPAFQPPREVLTPLYQRLFYGKLYNSLKWSALLDRNWLLNLLTFGTHNRLIEACVNEVDTHSKVLQLGGTFGNQLPELADKVGFYGRLDVIDIKSAAWRENMKPFIRKCISFSRMPKIRLVPNMIRLSAICCCMNCR